MSGLGGASLLATGAGTALDIYGNIRSAKIASALGRMRQKAAKEAAMQTRASGQRAAMEEKRQAEIMASRAIAVAAASGGDTSDPSISKVIADIQGEGAYRAAVAMYNAEDEAKKLIYEGKMAKVSGQIEASNYRMQAVSSLLKGAGSMGATYKLGGYG